MSTYMRKVGFLMRHKNWIKTLEISLLCAFVISAAFSMTAFARSCEVINESVLRMHVIANSDSEADQALKLQVRDAVLAAGADIFDGSVTAGEAEQRILPRIDELTRVAEETVRAAGFDYAVKVSVTQEYFNTRTYEGSVTLPAGVYHAVKVIIGSGQGQNWWCVMFPPLCLPAAADRAEIDAVLQGEEIQVVEANPQYEPRFKIVEWFNQIKEKLS